MNQAELKYLRARVLIMESALRKLEWIPDESVLGSRNRCPVCRRLESREDACGVTFIDEGHAEDCWVAKVLAGEIAVNI